MVHPARVVERRRRPVAQVQRRHGLVGRRPGRSLAGRRRGVAQEGVDALIVSTDNAMT
jgi:hypothetical protein